MVSVLDERNASGAPTTLTVIDDTVRLVLDKTAGTIGLTCEALLPSGEGVVVARMARGSQCRASGMLAGHLLLSACGELALTHRRTICLIDAAPRYVELVYRDSALEVEMERPAAGLGCGASLREHHEREIGVGIGAQVASVAADSAAAACGLEAGDLLLSVDGELIRSAAHAAELLDATAGDATGLDEGLAGSTSAAGTSLGKSVAAIRSPADGDGGGRRGVMIVKRH